MATNRHGLDQSYFTDKLALIQRDIDNYTPAELARELARLAVTADHQAAITDWKRSEATFRPTTGKAVAMGNFTMDENLACENSILVTFENPDDCRAAVQAQRCLFSVFGEPPESL